MKNSLFYALTLLATPLFGMAQQASTAEAPVHFMYSAGRSYLVVSVIALIFIGIAAYLFHLDRKITKLENEK